MSKDVMDPKREAPSARRPALVRRVWGWIGHHRLISGAVGLMGLGLVIFVLVWFQPQKLFLDQRVNEELPGVQATAPVPATPATSGSPTPTAAPEADGRVTLAAGEFRSLEHGTTGRALILEIDGKRFLRFEDLNTSNGPDLHVYLSEIPAGDDWYAYGERFVSLGKLKGNIGSQNYRIPRDVELSKYVSAVIWCKRFSVGFGVAPLDPQ